jgi:hypothetical protein
MPLTDYNGSYLETDLKNFSENESLNLTNEIQRFTYFSAYHAMCRNEDDEKMMNELHEKMPVCANDTTQQIFFRLNHANNKHFNFKYKSGLNVDINEFKPEGQCSGGGLYFSKLEKLNQFKHFGTLITPVIVPKYIPYYHEYSNRKFYDKYKSHVLYMLPQISIDSVDAFKLLEDTQSIHIARPYINKTHNLEHIQKYTETLMNGCIPKSTYMKYNINKFNMYIAVKKMLQNKQYDELYTHIIDNSDIVPEHKIIYKKDYVIPSQKCNITKILYTFKDKKDNELINYLKTYFFPKFIDQHQTRNILNISKIDEDQSNMIRDNVDDVILGVMKKYDGYISGSFALKYFAGLQYMADDVDIYVRTEHTDNIKQDMCQYIRNHQDAKFEETLPNYNMSNITDIINISIGEKKYQIIFVDCDPIKFVTDNFDFDFCMCLYNIQDGYISIKQELKSFNVGQITQSYINKTTGTNKDSYSTYRACKTIDRIMKYTKRGFIITNIMEFLNEIESKMFV